VLNTVHADGPATFEGCSSPSSRDW
jgi:hypothetical protein